MDGPAWRVFMGERGAEQCHQPIAAILVNSALEPMNFSRNELKSTPHDLAQVLRVELLAYRGKSGDIAEQYGYLPAFTLNCGMLRPNLVCQMGRRLKRLRGRSNC
jgi:hypothetical protein